MPSFSFLFLKYIRSVIDTKARRGADIGSGHQLAISGLKLKLKRMDKKNKVERRRFDVRKLRDPICKESFRLELTMLEGMEVEDSVDTLSEGFKTVFNESASSVVGKRKKVVKDWISEYTINMIEEKKIKNKINSTRSTRIAVQ